MLARHAATGKTHRFAGPACLATALLIAGCGAPPVPASATLEQTVLPATASPLGDGNPSPTPAPTATAQPVPTLRPGELGPGLAAITVVDRLVVRSKPQISSDSIMYGPVLPIGTELLVLDGPVAASGYTWYRVAPTSFTLKAGVTDGWVAMAARDGTPWVASAEDSISGLELAQAAVARGPVSPAGAKAAANSINAFAIDLYRQLLGGPDLKSENAVFSPTSILLALAMARGGARGQTAAQLDATLHANGWDALAAALNSLDQALASKNATWKDEEGKAHALSLKIANAAFGQRGWPIEPGYLNAIATALGSGLGLVDYRAGDETARKAINAWVSSHTAKRVPELLGPGDVDTLTRLVLVNAVYLKANWMEEFPVEATRLRAFTRLDRTKVMVPTMALVGDQGIPYAHGTGWRATELLYAGSPSMIGYPGGSSLAMTLIVPDDLAKFETGLKTASLGSITAALASERRRQQEVTSGGPDDCGTYPYALELNLPRFGIRTRADLLPALDGLGIGLATTPSADFSGISTAEPIWIKKVIHQANVDVDEKGTEAAAATAVSIVAGGCTGPDPAKAISLKFDRPFLFLIRDLDSGAILFMGRVTDPSAPK